MSVSTQDQIVYENIRSVNCKNWMDGNSSQEFADDEYGKDEQIKGL